MLEFCTGVAPFENLSDKKCLMKINKRESPLDYYLQNHTTHNPVMNNKLQDMLKQCFYENFK